ncbi:branched-chain amino acid ABC transporter ATP-binding protein [Archaeoglobales archaeon]|nr:MAG: branched-chain amino acid ABC transporter ATP-binding protein [Archaeoglobales archaeon]
MAILEVEGLRAYYGKAQILQGINFGIEEGETFTILGPNGAGKTTLIKSILGLVKTEGGIKFKGEDITGLKTHERIARGVAVCPEGRKLFPNLSIEDNLKMGALGRDGDDTLEMVYTLFPRLRELRNHIAKRASGGEQQMVAIGRALMSNPSLLLFDEPSMGLAPIIIENIKDSLLKMKNEMDVSILMVEQNVKMALDLADKVAVLVKGRFVKEGDRSSLGEVEKLYFEI